MTMEAKLFKNYTDEVFTWKFNGMVHTFQPGQEIYLEDFKADHFAKHLVDRELTKANIQTNNEQARKQLTAKCFPVAEVVTSEEALNLNTKKEKKSEVKEEKEFEELEEVTTEIKEEKPKVEKKAKKTK